MTATDIGAVLFHKRAKKTETAVVQINENHYSGNWRFALIPTDFFKIADNKENHLAQKRT